MRGCVYSKYEISVIESWVIKYFNEIPKRELERRVFNELPFDTSNLGNFWKIVPVKDNDYLDFSWIIPGSFRDSYKTEISKIITHLFGHEGENSLISFLRDEGLATDIEASRDEEMNLFKVISVRIKLTPKGFENYKEVIAYFFEFLQIVKEKGNQKWIFDEIKNQLDIDFKFLEKTEPVDFVTNLSPKMLYYPYEDIIKLKYYFEKYDDLHIKEEIEKLEISNLRIHLISKKCESSCDKIEEIYSIQYSTQLFDQEIFDLYNCRIKVTPKISKKKLDLPPKNIFIPQNFHIFNSDKGEFCNQPVKILDQDLSVVWYKQDNKFLVPKAAIYCRIYTKEYNLLCKL